MIQDSESKANLINSILFCFLLIAISAGVYSLALFFMGILVFGCLNIPPDWIYLIIIIGIPIPLLISDIIAVYFFYNKKSVLLILLSIFGGILLTALIFLIWFFVMANYC